MSKSLNLLFENLYKKNSNADFLEYNGQRLYRIYKIPIVTGELYKFKLLKSDAPKEQGAFVKTTDGSNFIANDKKRNKVAIMESDFSVNPEIYVSETKSKKTGFIIYNIWYEKKIKKGNAWQGNAAMKVDYDGKNKWTFYCNDEELDEDFDDLIFTVEKIPAHKK